MKQYGVWVSDKDSNGSWLSNGEVGHNFTDTFDAADAKAKEFRKTFPNHTYEVQEVLYEQAPPTSRSPGTEPEPEPKNTWEDCPDSLITRSHIWSVSGIEIEVIEGSRTMRVMNGECEELTADEADALSLALLEAREELA